MPVYKDEQRGTWYFKRNYRDWQGETRTKLKRGFATKREAQQGEREFLDKQSGNMNMKLAAFVEVYFNDKGTRLKERSIMTKRTLIETKIIPYFGEKSMNEITAVDIIKWQNLLMKQEYSPTYLRMIQNQLTALFNHAERFYDLRDNPCKKVDKMGRSNARELNFWTKDEYEVFLETFAERDEMYRLIFQMLFWLGCRIGEALALTSLDIDLEKATISVSKTYFRRNKTDYITSPKTESSNRKITIPKFLKGEIKEYLDRQYELAPDERNFPITDRAVQKKMKQKTEEANRARDLLDEFAKYLLELPEVCVVTEKELNDPNWKPPFEAGLIVHHMVYHGDENSPHIHMTYIPYTTNSSKGAPVQNAFAQTFKDLGYSTTMKQAVTETGELVWQKDEDGRLKPQMKRNSYGGADWVEAQKAVLQEMMLKEFGWERFYKGSNPRGNLTLSDYRREKAAEMAKEEERKLEDIKDKVATGQATFQAQTEQMEAMLESLDKGAEAERQLSVRITDKNAELNEVLQDLTDKRNEVLEQEKQLTAYQGGC